VNVILPFVKPPPPEQPIQSDESNFADGIKSALNLTVPKIIKAAPGRLCKLIVLGGGTSGTFTLNDCCTLDTAAAANVIFTIGYGVKIGTVIELDWPCASGMALSAVPDGGVLAVSYS
jgi:hypothetical protein